MGAGDVPQPHVPPGSPVDVAGNVVGIFTALDAEARSLGPLKRGPAGAERGSNPGLACRLVSLGDGSLVAIGGMGPAAADRAAGALVAGGATALVSWGMAGGLDPELAPGTLFLADEIVERTGTPLATTRRWREGLAHAAAAHCVVAGGRLLTSDRLIGTVADKTLVRAETGAAAVDMESMAIARRAREHGLPFIAARVIVDSARDAVPRSFLAAIGPSGELRVGRLLGALATAPGDVVELIRLGRRYAAAGRSLRAVARTGGVSAPSLAFARA